MLSYADLLYEDWVNLLQEEGEKEFHAKQIISWLYNKGVLAWEGMTNLSRELREKLSTKVRLGSLELVRMTESNDGETFKFLWRLHDNNLVESVLICSADRRTVCVSSQVGCPARCAFCASGQGGFIRNLRPTEIVEQVLQINHWLAKRNEKVCHIVYMGMGEPFKNYEAVIQSARIFTQPEFLNISQRRLTISTVGVVEGIKRLTDEGMKINLVLSLHAPNQHIRKKIIPYARKYPLEDILNAMDEYTKKTKRDVTYEYTLIAGINDHPDHAHELAHLLKGKQCTVNLIPYNPIPGVKLKRPEKKIIKQFRSVLFGCGIVNTCRYTKGVDIAAACGQLALQEKQESAEQTQPVKFGNRIDK